MSTSHRNSGPGHHTRAAVVKVDDSGPQQKVAMTGLNGQRFDETVRSQPFGFTSVPPAGSEGVAIHMGGGADRVHALNPEHPDLRPRNLKGGATRIYDKDGNHVHIDGDTIRAFHKTRILLKVGDNVTVTMNGDTVTISAPNIKLNGLVDING